MKPCDIPAGLSLCRAAAWNQVASDWEMILDLSLNNCRVATKEDKVVGTVTTIRYQDFFGWIGMVLVDPACRGQGIGSQFLKEALQMLHDAETIKLDATPAGRKVYLKYDFVDEYPLQRMFIPAARERMNEPGGNAIIRAFQKSDLTAIAAFDHEVFGANRQSLLKWMLEGAPQYAFLAEAKGKMGGYCLGREGYNFTHIGPVIAENAVIAKNLLSAALNNCICSPAILDVSPFDVEWVEWLTFIGFTKQRSLIRMRLGSNKYCGIWEKQFAILGPEFG